MLNLEDKKYTKAEVLQLMRKAEFDYETNLSEKKDRIFQLLADNKKLVKEVQIYRDRDQSVGKALMNAVSKAKEIEDTAKMKFQAGVNRLKVFESKFVNYYKLVMTKYPVDENLMQVDEFLKKMEDILGQDNFSKNIDKQSMFKNTASQNPNMYGVSIPNESGFNINEALNPSKDLEDICRELGLIE